jgi:hypothetical protein
MKPLAPITSEYIGKNATEMFVREGKHAEVLDRQREREKDCLE